MLKDRSSFHNILSDFFTGARLCISSLKVFGNFLVLDLLFHNEIRLNHLTKKYRLVNSWAGCKMPKGFVQ